MNLTDDMNGAPGRWPLSPAVLVMALALAREGAVEDGFLWSAAFGAAEALQVRVQAFRMPVSSYVIQMAPYILALAGLATMGRSSRLPAAIGRPLR